MASVERPSQYSQPSRKTKKAWRKNVDLTELQSGLDTAREEVILTGGVISELPSESLFVVDTTATPLGGHGHQIKSRLLKSDIILAARSAVPAVSSRKSAATSFSKSSDGVLTPKRHRSTPYATPAKLQRLKDSAAGSSLSNLLSTGLRTNLAGSTIDHDPWAPSTVLEGDLTVDPEFSFLPAPELIKPPCSMRHPPISLSKTGVAIPAVKCPGGEGSYNPQSSIYFSAFVSATQREEVAEQKRLAAEEKERSLRERWEINAKIPNGDRMVVDIEAEEESVWEGLDTDVELDENAQDGLAKDMKTSRPQRKTQVQRNRIKRRKAEEARTRLEAKRKVKEEQVNNVEMIAQAVEAKTAARRVEQEEKRIRDAQQEGDDSVLRRRRFGKSLIPEKRLELVLPSELRESLRLLKPEGNILGDRYRSQLVRGKIQMRAINYRPRKRKEREVVKWGHREWKLIPQK